MLAGCAAPPPRPAASRPRPTIVSLNPCSDAVLAEVADRRQILAISRYSHDPRATSMDLAVARRFPATAGTVEEIVALRPDVVIGDSFVQPATADALARLGIPLVRMPISDSLATSAAQVRTLARLAGHPERSAALLARIERALAAAAPPPGAVPIPAIVWQGGGLVPGERTLIAELLGPTGFANAVAARGLGQGAVLGLEAMIARPPRVILAAGDPRADEDRLLAHPALAALAPGTLRARFDPRLLYCGGPSVMPAAARLASVRREVVRRKVVRGAVRDEKPLSFRGGVRVGVVPRRDAAGNGEAPPPAPPLKERGEV
ncbi:MAG: ABC transporter substrate-binding protein [Novosphingobium sp.]